MPTPCSVTGTLQTLTSGRIAQGKVIFQLTNIGTGNPIGISGTSILPALTYTVMTAQDGTFSVSLWGNDNITPANTLYAVTFRDYQGNEIGPILYSIVGASVNLNTLIASGTTVPPVIIQTAIVGNPTAPQTITGQSLTLTSSAPFIADTETVGKLDNIRIVDGAKFLTIDAAIADLPVGGGLVIIPSTYAGAEASTSGSVDGLQESNTADAVTVLDLRTGATTGYNIQYNSRSQDSANNIETRLSVWQKKTALSVARTSSAILGTNMITGNTPNQTFAGITGETWTTGAITPGSGVLLGGEFDTTINSTGGTLPDVRGVYGNVAIRTPGATTNITNAYSVFAGSMSNGSSSGATITNAYAIFASKPTVGTSTNLSIRAAGATQFDGLATFDNSAVGIRNVLVTGNATTNNNTLEIQNTAAGGHTWDIGEMQATGRLTLKDLTQANTPSFSLLVAGAGFEGILSHANAANRTYLFPDFTPASMGGIIASGTSTLTANAALGAVTSQAVITTAATNVLTTDAIEWSYASAPGAGDSLCIISPYVTAGNVNFVRSNPTAAAQNVSAIVINWRVVR